MNESVADVIRRCGQDWVTAEDELVQRLKDPDRRWETEQEIIGTVGRSDVDWELALDALVLAEDALAAEALKRALEAAASDYVKDSVAVTLGRLGDHSSRELIATRATTAVAEDRSNALRLIGAVAQVDLPVALDLAEQWLLRHRSAVFRHEETAIQPLLICLEAADPGAIRSLTFRLRRRPEWPEDDWEAAVNRWRRIADSS